MEHKLDGCRVAVLAADGFEKVELVIPAAALRVAGADVDVVSLRHGSIRGVKLHEPASRVAVDYTVSEVSAQDYDALLIPGGFINPDLLRQSAAARQFVRDFDAASKPIATLCHGPWVLSSAGLVKGRRMTSWPGVRDDMVNAGAIWLDQEVVRDRNWLTSRGPQDISPFTKAMIPFFAHEAAEAHIYLETASSPQPDAPPDVVLGRMNWVPSRSVRAAAVAGAVVAYFVARQRGRMTMLG